MPEPFRQCMRSLSCSRRNSTTFSSASIKLRHACPSSRVGLRHRRYY
jgi:hypothetical protein